MLENKYQATSEFSYKLIIMDLNMPLMDGFEASEKILKFSEDNISLAGARDNECNIIALTSYSDQESIDRCLKIGMKEVIHKPIQSDQLKRLALMYLYGLTE